uniref:Uncharacterized protein n=1 Tax=viral metagenome TaxID=1070528 RepID=A0A6C0KVL9_9ZZZZ
MQPSALLYFLSQNEIKELRGQYAIGFRDFQEQNHYHYSIAISSNLLQFNLNTQQYVFLYY